MYTQTAKIARDYHGCVPPIDSSDSSAPMLAAKIPIPAIASGAKQREPGGELDDADER